MWLATGGRSGVNDRVDILKNRKNLVFADWLIRWKQAPDTMTLPADTPIQQARLELVLNELRHYWSEETVQETITIHVNAAFPGHTESDGIVFYLSEAGRKAIIGLHVDGIVAYLNDAEPELFR